MSEILDEILKSIPSGDTLRTTIKMLDYNNWKDGEYNGDREYVEYIARFVEQNYVSKEEYEKALNDAEMDYDTKLRERQATDISFAVSHIEEEKDLEIQKLKEENEILKREVYEFRIMGGYNKAILDAKREIDKLANVKDATFNAPEPSIDLNKE